MLFERRRQPDPQVVVIQGASEGITRRRFLRRAATTTGKVGLGVAVGAAAVDRFTGFDVLAPFKGETREQVTERVRRQILEVAELISLKIDDEYKIVIEKDAPILDSVFDKRATGRIPTQVELSADLSFFNTAPVIDDVSSLSNSPPTAPSTTLPPVPFVGGMPAIEVSEDKTSIIVRLPHITIPSQSEVMLDLERAEIINGQGGLGDRLQNFFNIHKIDPTKFYLRAQKEAIERLKKEPDLLFRAESSAKRTLENMLRFGFPHATVEFVDREAGPKMPDVNPAANQKAQAGR